MAATFFPKMTAEAELSDADIESKELRLRAMMQAYGKVLVAYSGGVDSSYLSLIARQELGSSAVCILGISPSVSEMQRTEARAFADDFELNFREIETEELNDPHYQANPTNRCYFCKSELYARLREIAVELNIDNVVDGTNADDVKGHRPGMAAAKENAVTSPLAELGFNKKAVRILSKRHGVKGWDKPASPCLSSRIAYGVPVTIERLSQIERAEAVLRSKGFHEFRVRSHGDRARIELSKIDMPRFFENEHGGEIIREIEKIGFRNVTLDPEGFRSGSMHQQLILEKSRDGKSDGR